MTLSEEIGQLLETLGLGDYRSDGAIGGSIFLGGLPQGPDLALGVGIYGLGESDSVNAQDEQGWQIRIRGPAADVRVAEQKAFDTYSALHGLGPRILAGGTWLQLAIGANGGPVSIGRDVHGRPEWTVNVRADIDRPTQHRP